MRRIQQGFLWLGVLTVAAQMMCPAVLGQASSNSKAEAGLPTDWSHHFLIFSKPGTDERARQVEQDPRYWQQRARQSPVKRTISDPRTAEMRTEAETHDASDWLLDPNAMFPRPVRESKKLQRDWQEDMGGSATVGAGNYPAKYSFSLTTANCGSATQPDYVVYTTGLGVNSATIVGYDNLYSGCSGTVPSTYWAYDTGGTITTSPALSYDGTQIAFMQADTFGHASLVLLKWAKSTTETITLPQLLVPTTAGLYHTCSAPPCMVELPLTDGILPSSDTNSSVFYNYFGDVAYVGDDSGYLHKFSPVFSGTPAEITTGGWPVDVNAGANPLTDPVHDTVSGNVFVEDLGGFLYAVNSAGAVTTSGQLDYSAGFPGFVQGPVVDSTGGFVYVFAPSDNSGACAGEDCAAIYQLSTTFTAGSTGGTEAHLGVTGPDPLYIGAFDSAYQNSTPPVAGDIYVCANIGGSPTLYQAVIASGSFSSVATGPVIGDTTTPCSPVTDVLNPNASSLGLTGPTEWMFASTTTEGSTSTCSGGCIYNFVDAPWQPSTTFVVGQEILAVAGGVMQIETVVSSTGQTSLTQPSWRSTIGGTTSDGLVHWINQGPLKTSLLTGWKANHPYTVRTEILDSHNNIELVTAIANGGSGNSGVTTPAFSLTAGGTVTVGIGLNSVTWENVGVNPSADLAAAGGTSGIIIDNTVGAGTEAGASQIYFSTLGNQCAGGTEGCAVQASQPELQ
jgi:hypothetical protein